MVCAGMWRCVLSACPKGTLLHALVFYGTLHTSLGSTHGAQICSSSEMFTEVCISRRQKRRALQNDPTQYMMDFDTTPYLNNRSCHLSRFIKMASPSFYCIVSARFKNRPLWKRGIPTRISCFQIMPIEGTALKQVPLPNSHLCRCLLLVVDISSHSKIKGRSTSLMAQYQG